LPVAELTARMSALEETYWAAYFKDDPWGDHRADIRNGQLMELIYKLALGKKAKKRQFTEWLPFYRKRIKEDDPEAITKVRALFDHFRNLKK